MPSAGRATVAAGREAQAPPLEILRQLREEGTELGASTFYRLYARAREAVPAELMVRFEGVAGEFAQLDFGQADVRLRNGGKKGIRSAAYRAGAARVVRGIERRAASGRLRSAQDSGHASIPA